MIDLVGRILKSYYRRRGYQIVFRKYKLFEGKYPQSVVLPRATYSPWAGDPAFQEVFEKIRFSTKVDVYRCYELWQLVGEVATLPGDILEVGVWRGGTAAVMAVAAGPDTRLVLCDTFEGVAKAGAEDNKYRGGEHADTSKDQVQDLLSNRIRVRNFEIHQGVFPDDTGAALSDRRFKLCHIDVDVYEGARSITEWVWERMLPGGVVVYDDFGFSGTQGVTKFLEEQRGKPGRLVIHNLNGHGLLVKTG